MKQHFSTSIHEAGHCVASWMLQATPLGCRIFIDGDTSGGVATASPLHEATATLATDALPNLQQLSIGINQQSFIHEAITDFAGYASQAELLGETSARIAREEITPDLLRVRSALLAIDPDATEQDLFLFEELTFRMARRFCRKHSSLILSIAGQLKDKLTLSQADVLRIIYPSVKITEE